MEKYGVWLLGASPHDQSMDTFDDIGENPCFPLQVDMASDKVIKISPIVQGNTNKDNESSNIIN